MNLTLNETSLYGPGNAADGFWDTKCWAAPGHGKAWLRMYLLGVQCIERVIWYTSDERILYLWQCSRSDCDHCVNGVGGYCHGYDLTIIREKYPALEADTCAYQQGDVVTLQANWKLSEDGSFDVWEIVVITPLGMTNIYNTIF